jgi:hypothetical protein
MTTPSALLTALHQRALALLTARKMKDASDCFVLFSRLLQQGNSADTFLVVNAFAAAAFCQLELGRFQDTIEFSLEVCVCVCVCVPLQFFLFVVFLS